MTARSARAPALPATWPETQFHQFTQLISALWATSMARPSIPDGLREGRFEAGPLVATGFGQGALCAPDRRARAGWEAREDMPLRTFAALVATRLRVSSRPPPAPAPRIRARPDHNQQ